jgi:6-phosphogluconate dehydrogenase (decarboxylating)
MCCKYLASPAFISRTSKPSNSVSLSLLLNIREKDIQLSTNHHTENYRLSHKNTSKKTGDASEGHAVPAPLLALVATERKEKEKENKNKNKNNKKIIIRNRAKTISLPNFVWET